MEKSIITSGKTIDLAIESALSQLGLDRDSVSVTVLQQAKSGFLGFGAPERQGAGDLRSPRPRAGEGRKAQERSGQRLPLQAQGPCRPGEEAGSPSAAQGRAAEARPPARSHTRTCKAP